MYNKFNCKNPGNNNYLQLTEMKKILTICLIILISSGFSNKTTQSGTKGKETVFKTKSNPENPRNTEGDFITLKDGRILFIYTHFTKGAEGSPHSDFGNAYLAGRYSNDQGKTWADEDVKIVEQEGAMNVMSVSLLRLQNGKIALFYLKKNTKSDCIPYMRISTDEAKTWSEPVQCITDNKGYFVVNNNRVIQLKNGRLLMPSALHKTEDSEYSNSGKIWCYYSDNNGATWKRSREVLKADSVITQEPAVIELKNGDIMMLIRANHGIQYKSYSKDKGLTWSKAEPSTIKSPLSPASIARIPSTGDLFLVWNNNGEKGPGYFKGKRNPFTVAISKDEGKTWQNIKNIEDDPDLAFCYGAIHFTENNVLIAYGVWGPVYVNEYITRVSYDWIYK
jgi:sialidase-1